MAAHLGSSQITKIYLGSVEIQKIYLGSVLAYSPAIGNTKPVISIIGSSLYNMPEDLIYIDREATAFDSEDGDITTSIARSGQSDIVISGGAIGETFNIFYDVNDSGGLAADTVPRTINIIAPTIPLIPGGLQITWTDQILATELSVSDLGSGIDFTNDGGYTWTTLNGGVHVLPLGEGPYELRETIAGVTGCVLTQTPGVSAFLGDVVAVGGDSLTTAANMFSGMDSIDTINVTNLNTFGVTDMTSMFKECTLVPEIDVSNFKTSAVTSMKEMFSECNTITHLLLDPAAGAGFDMTAVTDTTGMFNRCLALECLKYIDTTGGVDATTKFDMFAECSSLVQPEGWNNTGTYNVGSPLENIVDVDGFIWTNGAACPIP